MFEKKEAPITDTPKKPTPAPGGNMHANAPLEEGPKQYYIFKTVSLLEKFNFYEYLATMLD